jgi:uncharacterized Zn finger protein
LARKRNTYNNYYGFGPTRPIQAKNGIKARSQRGAFTKNWWATRWIQAMERLVDAGRLSRGRSYARRGQVLSIEEQKNGVEARVQGSRRTPYKVKIEIAPLSDAQWDKVTDALAEQALFAAQLLAGEMPKDIDSAFQSAGVSLFPARRGDLTTSCSCPDWSNPCKHIAATHYILGERFDEDPFMLFRLRGRSPEQILQGLRQRRAGKATIDEDEEVESEVVVPLAETLGHFWDLCEPLDTYSVNIKAPTIEIPLLKRLGEPAFAPEPGLQYLLLPAIRAISIEARQTAFAEGEGDGREGENHA